MNGDMSPTKFLSIHQVQSQGGVGGHPLKLGHTVAILLAHIPFFVFKISSPSVTILVITFPQTLQSGVTRHTM